MYFENVIEMYSIVRKIPTVIFCKVKIRFLLNAILHENILDFYPNLLKIYFPLEEPGKNEYTYFNKYIAQEGKHMKKKIMSLILSAVLVAGAGMPATAYGEEFYSESAETSCGEEENSVVDDGSTENASAEGTENSWEEDQGDQTEPEAGFVDGGFGDMEEVQGGFEENPVEDAAGEDELWTDEEAEEITDLDASASGFGTARTISTNATYSTNLTTDVRERWFKFYVANAGTIALSFKHDFVDSSAYYWRATIYADGNHEELASYSFQGEKVLYTLNKFGVSPGYYYLKISDSSYFSDAKFQFRINYNQADNWERELNNDYKTANTIKVNTQYYGSLQKEWDEDWYKVQIPGNGSLSINFTHKYESGVWDIYLYNDQLEELEENSVRSNAVFDSEKCGVTPGIYYLKICPKKSYVCSSAEYGLKINFTASEMWEKEPNNDYSKATPISMNAAYYGSLQQSNDADWYKIDIPAAGSYELTFAHDYIQSNRTYWQAIVYDDLFIKKGVFEYRGNKPTTTNKFEASSRGTYHIKIYDDYWSNIPYSIKLTSHTHSYVTQATSATLYRDGEYTQKCSCGAIGGTGIIYHPSKIALSATTFIYNGHTQVPNVTVYDSKSNVIGPENYKVSYGRDGKSIGKHQLVISFQGKYSGSVTKTYTIKPRGTSIKKLTKLSKGFTVKWSKVSSATGYQIQYSTNKKFKKSSLSTIRKRTATSSKVRSLRGKKKYYVRIRTYKKVGGTTYYSAWSSAKAVTTKR